MKDSDKMTADSGSQVKGMDKNAKNGNPSPDLFSSMMHDVMPIKGQEKGCPQLSQKKSRTPQSVFKLRRKMATTETEQENHSLGYDHIEPVAPEDFIGHTMPGIRGDLFTTLKKGGFPIDYHLDLHGYTVDEAATTLADFIRFSLGNAFRCVRIIHGKSYKRHQNNEVTLKSLVARWLRQMPGVLAFCSCLPKDGGRGAVYVLLECHRKRKPG